MIVNKAKHSKKNKAISLVVAVVSLVFFSCGVNAQSLDLGAGAGANAGGYGAFFDPASKVADAEACNPYSSGSVRLANKCPDLSISRNDISPKCLEKLNQNTCLNTMPTNGVQRVPEDVCFREWSTRFCKESEKKLAKCNIECSPEDKAKDPTCKRMATDSKDRNHNGMDYAVTNSTDIYAAADGYVSRSTDCTKGGGRAIYIWHSKGAKVTGAAINNLPKSEKYETVYLHLSERYVQNGAVVKKGQPIGRAGGSSCNENGKISENAYGVHLHFEIRDGNGLNYDPMCQNIQGLCGGPELDTKSCRTNCDTNPGACASTTYINVGSATGGGGGGSGGGGSGSGSGGGGSGNAKANVTDGKLDSPGAKKKCDLSSYRDSYNDCIFCPLFTVLFNAASSIALQAYNTFAPFLITVILVGMALWIAIKIIAFISSMEVKDPRVLLKDLLRQIFVALIVIVILSAGLKEFLSLVIEPLFNTGFKLARLIVSGSDCGNIYNIMEDGGLPSSMGVSIVCTVKAVQDKILDTLSIGSLMLCIGFFLESAWHLPIFPHLGYVISGLLIWIAGFLLLVIYPFLLIDAVLQMSVAMGLLPAAIGCYAFKITRKYVGKIFESIMNSMLTFVFLSIVIYLITEQIEQIVQEPLRNILSGEPEYDSFLKQLSWSGVAFLQLVFVILLGWAVLGSVKEFVGHFSKGGTTVGGIGAKFGGTTMSAVKAVGTGVGKSVKTGAQRAGNVAGGMIKEKFNDKLMDYREKTIISRSKGQTDENGNATYSFRNWRGRKVTRTLKFDEDGNRKIVKHQQTLIRKRQVETENDGWIRTKTKVDSKGRVSQSTEMMTAAGRYLVNKDGTLNDTAISNIMNNSTFDSNIVQEAILRQIMKERMPGVSESKYLDSKYIKKTYRTETMQDKNGVDHEVFIIDQVNADGSTSSFSMRMDGGRARIDVRRQDRYGSVVSHMTDGIVNKTSKYDLDKKGNIKQHTVNNKYSFTGYYSQGTTAIDSNGVYRRDIPKERMMLDDDEIDELEAQFEDGTGNAALSGFK